jgi:hypothetical protein
MGSSVVTQALREKASGCRNTRTGLPDQKPMLNQDNIGLENSDRKVDAQSENSGHHRGGGA